jgi:hypothetical protein
MPKRVIENPVLSTRYVSLHAEFKPDGNPRDDLRPLMDLWIEIQTHLNRVNARELRERAREQQELGDATVKRFYLPTEGRFFSEMVRLQPTRHVY